MNFFQRIWEIEQDKWNLLCDYWFVWVILIGLYLTLIVSKDRSNG